MYKVIWQEWDAKNGEEKSLKVKAADVKNLVAILIGSVKPNYIKIEVTA